MKTTIEISDGVLEQAKAVAARERTTLRALVEAGLRQVVEARRHGPRFRLREASFGGKGLRPEFRDAGWELIRRVSYEDRGG
jgi:hypothetical protein